MAVYPKTIFSSSFLRNPEDKENKRISYWLEKLSNQEIERKKASFKKAFKLQEDNSVVEKTPEEKGTAEAVKTNANKAEKDKQAVEKMVSNSNRILMRVSSVFPWDLFPTHIVVEEIRITIIHRQLFSSQVHSVDIKNISNVFVDTSILFSKLTIVSDTFAENQIVISRIWKKEAIFIRRIIEGLRMFVAKDIDTTGYEIEDLKKKLGELSTTGIVL